MRSAVVLFGLVQRSIGHVADSLRKHVIAPLKARGEVDVYFHSWDVRELSNPRAGEACLTIDPADVGKHLPEARGRFDSEERFENLIEWGPIYGRNPMRYHCSGEEAARVAIRNVILTLHSLEMGFDLLNELGTGSYDCVVASRADVRFLKDLPFPAELKPWAIHLPSFHGWGGVNDRFAFGSRQAMEVYARRSSFFDGWMLNPGKENPEWILKKWLSRNRLEVKFIDFPFQRIRGNGEVFPLDKQFTGD
jgi:hypothetical protein